MAAQIYPPADARDNVELLALETGTIIRHRRGDEEWHPVAFAYKCGHFCRFSVVECCTCQNAGASCIVCRP